MYTNSRNAAHAYANVGLETGVVAASPHQLIIMLYEGAELAVRMAIKHMNEGDHRQEIRRHIQGQHHYSGRSARRARPQTGR